jgi:hypothetical protein
MTSLRGSGSIHSFRRSSSDSVHTQTASGLLMRSRSTSLQQAIVTGERSTAKRVGGESQRVLFPFHAFLSILKFDSPATWRQGGLVEMGSDLGSIDCML